MSQQLYKNLIYIFLAFTLIKMPNAHSNPTVCRALLLNETIAIYYLKTEHAQSKLDLLNSLVQKSLISARTAESIIKTGNTDSLSPLHHRGFMDLPTYETLLDEFQGIMFTDPIGPKKKLFIEKNGVRAELYLQEVEPDDGEYRYVLFDPKTKLAIARFDFSILEGNSVLDAVSIRTQPPFRNLGLSEILLKEVLQNWPAIKRVKGSLGDTNLEIFETNLQSHLPSDALKLTPIGKSLIKLGFGNFTIKPVNHRRTDSTQFVEYSFSAEK